MNIVRIPAEYFKILKQFSKWNQQNLYIHINQVQLNLQVYIKKTMNCLSAFHKIIGTCVDNVILV